MRRAWEMDRLCGEKGNKKRWDEMGEEVEVGGEERTGWEQKRIKRGEESMRLGKRRKEKGRRRKRDI